MKINKKSYFFIKENGFHSLGELTLPCRSKVVKGNFNIKFRLVIFESRAIKIA